jgi:hypothetical protein
MIFSPAHGDTGFTVLLFDEFMRRTIPEGNPLLPATTLIKSECNQPSKSLSPRLKPKPSTQHQTKMAGLRLNKQRGEPELGALLLVVCVALTIIAGPAVILARSKC